MIGQCGEKTPLQFSFVTGFFKKSNRPPSERIRSLKKAGRSRVNIHNTLLFDTEKPCFVVKIKSIAFLAVENRNNVMIGKSKLKRSVLRSRENDLHRIIKVVTIHFSFRCTVEKQREYN